MQSLYYSVFDTDVCTVLVVLNQDGCICYASLGKPAVELKRIMVKDFQSLSYQLKPLSTMKGDKAQIDKSVEKFKLLVEKPSVSQDIKIQIVFGTPFQRKVWKELIKIPAGEIRTYKELADSLGTHSRVVGNCCGANRVAVLIPCHRVVGANHKLTGYRWGKSYKEYLLKQEGIDI
ncbi:6-O-methylguanine-DNA methyltransferase, putative [Candida dubliniensis CD36]|uniref:Methylated-DNA--protein-cysteine methyltransferase n=1 Tax=Candida dubliniensis (strain CD36 / ATCC MYA-646 / CBS 7987 / NCPF 3949 / NRRL Y-17841) TaxID=573826 RepID=B9WF56_CANDC|nr:6-O-methylguanine-DNA methyltransferase, putative [Candida dubliniensis CD36]CAX42512.1 6-O-methylguanine-DNA methyltransferase, putative [Candida dubliniensis CD36]